ncbi:hypothetical protein BSL78_25966 [Apostichopus japonicus]|uniref:Uncharacterized protein n=1 Tax=Stichopus japonicus TaxID=307972 RepID=A0A2G8JNA5_STIJA|nr:hypothetical protein BSL78_25966 [Apostichopus japonicus]
MGSFAVLGLLLVAIPQIAGRPLLMITGSMGDIHVFLIRICGGVCLSSGLNIYLNYSSSDSYVRVALIFCVFLTAALESVVNIVTPISTKHKTDGATFGSFWLYKNIANASAQLMFVFMSSEFYGHSQLNSRLNMHMMIDFVLNLFQGIGLMAYPSLMLQALTNSKDFDDVEIILTQTYGAFCVGSGILSLLYSSALLNNNKRSVLLTRVLETLAIIIFILSTNFTTKALEGHFQAALFVYALISSTRSWCYSLTRRTSTFPRTIDAVLVLRRRGIDRELSINEFKFRDSYYRNCSCMK